MLTLFHIGEMFVQKAGHRCQRRVGPGGSKQLARRPGVRELECLQSQRLDRGTTGEERQDADAEVGGNHLAGSVETAHLHTQYQLFADLPRSLGSQLQQGASLA